MSIQIQKKYLQTAEIEKRGYLQPEELSSIPEDLNYKVVRKILSHNIHLKSVPNEMGSLRWVHAIDLAGCAIDEKTLEILPPFLRQLNIADCENIEKLSESLKNLEFLEELDVSKTYIGNDSLKNLPKSLVSLKIEDCPRITELPTDFKELENLKVLSLKGTKIDSFQNFPRKLEKIDARECPKLLSVPDLLKEFKHLEEIHFSDKYFQVNSIGHLPLDRLKLLTLGRESADAFFKWGWLDNHKVSFANRKYKDGKKRPSDKHLIKEFKNCFKWLKNVDIQLKL